MDVREGLTNGPSPIARRSTESHLRFFVCNRESCPGAPDLLPPSPPNPRTARTRDRDARSPRPFGHCCLSRSSQFAVRVPAGAGSNLNGTVRAFYRKSYWVLGRRPRQAASDIVLSHRPSSFSETLSYPPTRPPQWKEDDVRSEPESSSDRVA